MKFNPWESILSHVFCIPSSSVRLEEKHVYIYICKRRQTLLVVKHFLVLGETLTVRVFLLHLSMNMKALKKQ